MLIERLVGKSWQTVFSLKKVARAAPSLQSPLPSPPSGLLTVSRAALYSVGRAFFARIEIFAITIYGSGDCNCFSQLISWSLSSLLCLSYELWIYMRPLYSMGLIGKASMWAGGGWTERKVMALVLPWSPNSIRCLLFFTQQWNPSPFR